MSNHTYCSLHQHSDASFRDSCNKPEELAARAAKIGMKAIALTDHGNLHNFVKMYKACQKHGIKFIPGCCMPGQIVYTDRGPIPIEECTTEDRVITHKGRFQKVRQVSTRNYNGKTYTITPWNNTDVTLTDEHPVLVRDGENGELRWVRADEVLGGKTEGSWRQSAWRHFTCFPKRFDFENLGNPYSLDLMQVLDDYNHYVEMDGYIHCQRSAITPGTYGASVKSSVSLDYDFGHFVGLWLAEGSFGKEAKVLNFTLGSHEVRLKDRIVDYATRLGCSYSARDRGARNSIDIEIYSKPLARAFLKLFGKGCRNKSIPSELFYINNYSFHTGLLNGILDGDAKQADQTCLKLTNRTLIYQMKMLLAQQGVSVRVGLIKDDHYYIQWRESQDNPRYTQSDEDYLYNPVRKVVVQDYNGPVHNIAVEEDESYITDFCVHNCEFYFTHKHEDKERSSRHITVLAENNEGLANLYRLTSRANLPGTRGGGFFFRPRIDWDDLKDLHGGLIILSGCMNSPINFEFWKNEDYDQGRDYAKEMMGIVGRDNFFVELQNVNEKGKIYIPEQEIILDWSRRLADDLGVPSVCTNDCHYLNRDDAFAHEVLKAIDARMTLDDPIVDRSKGITRGRLVFGGFDYYVRSDEEMREKFSDEEVEMSGEIADRCNVDIPLGENHMPNFRGMSDDECYEFLVEECRRGWKRLKINKKQNKEEYLERLKKELAEVKDARLHHYFMIVWDVCRFCRENKIALGFGRGSCGGSLTLYLLGITQRADPIQYGLIWERFWNHGRKGSMPDIDLDIQPDRRDEVIGYLREQFGEDKVLPMMTMSTMAAKEAVISVGKVLGLRLDYLHSLTKLFPHKYKGLEDVIERVPEIADAAKGSDPDVKQWRKEWKKASGARKKELERAAKDRKEKLIKTFQVARRLENIAENRSTHACAILLSNKSIDGRIPTCWDAANRQVLTGFDMYDLEDLGYMKLDCLGLKTLGVINRIDPDFYNTVGDFDDPKVYKSLGSGHNKGVFQLESALGVKWTKRQQPKCIEDIADLITIIRPAALEPGLSDQYIENRRGKKKPEYIHPDLEPILESSEGCMIYQEQAIEIARKFAGFTAQRADNLRKVLGKKLEDKLPAFEAEFKQGVIERYDDSELADRLWEWLKHGAGYGFNKAHALTYGMMGYATAYYKVYHPVEFFCAMLQMSEYKQNTQEEIAELFYDAKRHDVAINPPMALHRNPDFEIIDGEIYYGLTKIKHVGKSTISALKKVDLSTWEGVVQNRKKLKKNVVEALIWSGALDYLEIPRAEMARQIEFLEVLTDREMEIFDTGFSGTEPAEFKGGKVVTLRKGKSLLSFRDTVDAFYRFMTDENPDLKVVTSRRAQKLTDHLATFLSRNEARESVAEMSAKESHYLGIPLTCCEVDSYNDNRKTHDLLGVDKELSGKGVATIGVVSRLNTRLDKHRRRMCFISLQDSTFMVDAVMFADSYDKYGKQIEVGDIIYAEGKKNGTGSFQIEKAEILEQAAD